MAFTAKVTIDSTKVSPEAMARLEAVLYGTDTTPPRLPLPEEIIAIIRGDGIVTPPPDPTPTDPNAALVEDPSNPGYYTIQNASMVEDPSDPGFYNIQSGVTEDPSDPGTYTIGAA